MCGIIFGVSKQPLNDFINEAHAKQRHRGPDAGDTYFEQAAGFNIGFAHQRLSILDLSELGKQPMASRSGQSLMVFNGEVYNYRNLIDEFDLHPLKSGSDTEVVLELIEKIGMEAACQKLNGMWSIIFFCRRTGTVRISRDRFGKKPINYLTNEHGIFFASEVASLTHAPGYKFEVDPISAARYLTQSLQNVDEHTWIKSIKSFPPGHIGQLDLSSDPPILTDLKAFWTPPQPSDEEQVSSQDWIEQLHSTVKDAVEIRLQADVPVGVALSGGIDSSIIAAVAEQQLTKTGQDIGMFSAVSPGAKEDESEFINVMEQYLGKDVSKFNLDLDGTDGLFDLLSHCISYNDGPVASFSNVLFYKLMEQARESGITVVLTGQGADEAFCGYRKYPFLNAKQLIKKGKVIKAAKSLVPFLSNGTILKDLKFAEVKRYLGKSNVSLLGTNTQPVFTPFALGSVNKLSDRQWQDIAHYSVPYLCHYEDRMSMALSCEVRAPFLDYRVVELGLKMPDAIKLRSGWTKWALRKAFEKDLPQEITWRKDKKGFVNPQDKWLKTVLKPYVLEIMEDSTHLVYEEGLVDQAVYLSMFEQYCEGNNTIWFRDVFAPFSLAVWMDIASQQSREISNS